MVYYCTKPVTVATDARRNRLLAQVGAAERHRLSALARSGWGADPCRHGAPFRLSSFMLCTEPVAAATVARRNHLLAEVGAAERQRLLA